MRDDHPPPPSGFGGEEGIVRVGDGRQFQQGALRDRIVFRVQDSQACGGEAAQAVVNIGPGQAGGAEAGRQERAPGTGRTPPPVNADQRSVDRVTVVIVVVEGEEEDCPRRSQPPRPIMGSRTPEAAGDGGAEPEGAGRVALAQRLAVRGQDGVAGTFRSGFRDQ